MKKINKNSCDVQFVVSKFCKKHKLKAPVVYRILDLMSEVGELSKEILKKTNYGKNNLKTDKEIKKELGDVFFSLLVLANLLKVDLHEALHLVLDKYETRAKKGGIGSEND